MTKQDLRIVFLGTPEFAVESLDKLYTNGYNIVGVVTMPDKPAGRGHKMLRSPVKQYAEAHGLHLMQPIKLKSPEFVDELRSLNADLFVVIAFRMLPEVVWTMPRLGTFNLHASLLPDYRGAAPINWAVINGEKVTGVTTFFLQHAIDTGDIIDRVSVEINDDDNVGDVHDRLMHLGADLTLKTVEAIVSGTLTTTPQADLLTDGRQPKEAPKIFKDTCRLDWSETAEKVHNLVRGLSPYPAAWTEIVLPDGKPLNVKIFTTKPGPSTQLAPGTVKIDGDRLFIACSDNLLEILSLQLAGKRRMTAAEFMRGQSLNGSTAK